MPTAAFIVTLNLPEISAEVLSSEADNMLDALTHAGFDVFDLQPWQHPALALEIPPLQPFNPNSQPESSDGLLGPSLFGP